MLRVLMSQRLIKKLAQKEYVDLRQALEKVQHDLLCYPDYYHTTEAIELALLTLTITWAKNGNVV